MPFTLHVPLTTLQWKPFYTHVAPRQLAVTHTWVYKAPKKSDDSG